VQQTIQEKKRASWGWFWQSVTGILLLLLLGLHMVAHHFVVEGGLRDYAQVLDYLRNPLIVVTELAFLISVTAHALLGLRAILFDLGLRPHLEQAINIGAVVVGALTILYGFWLTFTILANGSAPTAFLFR
jgi:succinate dehydrogenase hydrophobic anchor subunit